MSRSESTADLVLHPVRLRIIQALLGGRELTANQISAEIDDVSTATVRRHIATLEAGGMLRVADEQRVRGAMERTYALSADAREVTYEDLDRMTPAEHKRAFTAFVTGLLSSFDRYIDRGDIDFLRDGVSYRHNALWLSDEELRELLTATRELYLPYAANGPGEGRVRRLMSTVMFPDPDTLDQP